MMLIPAVCASCAHVPLWLSHDSENKGCIMFWVRSIHFRCWIKNKSWFITTKTGLLHIPRASVSTIWKWWELRSPYHAGGLKANEAKWITVVLSEKDNGPGKYPMMASDNANTSSCGESSGEGKSSDSAHGQPRTFGRVKMRNRIEVVWEENML